MAEGDEKEGWMEAVEKYGFKFVDWIKEHFNPSGMFGSILDSLKSLLTTLGISSSDTSSDTPASDTSTDNPDTPPVVEITDAEKTLIVENLTNTLALVSATLGTDEKYAAVQTKLDGYQAKLADGTLINNAFLTNLDSDAHKIEVESLSPDAIAAKIEGFKNSDETVEIIKLCRLGFAIDKKNAQIEYAQINEAEGQVFKSLNNLFAEVASDPALEGSAALAEVEQKIKSYKQPLMKGTVNFNLKELQAELEKPENQSKLPDNPTREQLLNTLNDITGTPAAAGAQVLNIALKVSPPPSSVGQ